VPPRRRARGRFDLSPLPCLVGLAAPDGHPVAGRYFGEIRDLQRHHSERRNVPAKTDRVRDHENHNACWWGLVGTHFPHPSGKCASGRPSEPAPGARRLQSRLSSGGVILSPVVARLLRVGIVSDYDGSRTYIAAIRAGFPVVVSHIAGLPTRMVCVDFKSAGPNGWRHAGDPVAEPYVRGPISGRIFAGAWCIDPQRRRRVVIGHMAQNAVGNLCLFSLYEALCEVARGK
jgi:hypothetical protein